MLEILEATPKKKPDGCLILIHGLGADANDLAPLVRYLGFPEEHGVKVVLPNAPRIPVTINNGMVMPAWYDILSLSSAREVDMNSVESSRRKLETLIQKQLDEGIVPGRIFLGGFSQGAAMSLYIGLRYPARLGGIIALSGYLFDEMDLPGASSEGTPPIFMAHGDGDEVVPYALGEKSRDTLTNNGYDVEWHSYPMGHSICDDEIRDVAEWFAPKAFPEQVDP